MCECAYACVCVCVTAVRPGVTAAQQSTALCWVALGKQRKLTVLCSDCPTSPLTEKVKKGTGRAQQIRGEARNGGQLRRDFLKSDKIAPPQWQNIRTVYLISSYRVLTDQFLHALHPAVTGWLSGAGQAGGGGGGWGVGGCYGRGLCQRRSAVFSHSRERGVGDGC